MDCPCNNKCEKFVECRNSVIKKANKYARTRCYALDPNLARYDVFELIEEELFASCEKLRKFHKDVGSEYGKYLTHYIEPHIPTKQPPDDWKHFLELEDE